MPARTPIQVGHGLSPLSLESPWGHAGYIARTIKSFEKALHSIFTHPSYPPHPAHQFSHLAQPTLQNGHSQRVIRAEREVQRAPFAKPFGPN